MHFYLNLMQKMLAKHIAVWKCTFCLEKGNRSAGKLALFFFFFFFFFTHVTCFENKYFEHLSQMMEKK